MRRGLESCGLHSRRGDRADGELIEDHIREHVSNPQTDPDQARAQGTAELIDAIRTYLK